MPVSKRRREGVLSRTLSPQFPSNSIPVPARRGNGPMCQNRTYRGNWQATKKNDDAGLLPLWRVKHAIDFHDIVVEQTLGLEHGPRRIGRLAPQFGLHLVDEGSEPGK